MIYKLLLKEIMPLYFLFVPFNVLLMLFVLLTLHFMKTVWHIHNLMIPFSVGSGHPDKSSYEIPDEETSRGK